MGCGWFVANVKHELVNSAGEHAHNSQHCTCTCTGHTVYDLPPNASSALKVLAQRTAAANAVHPSVFSLHEYLRPGSLGYKSVEGSQTAATFTLMIGGGQSDAKVNASVDAFASALNASTHKEKLFRYGASLHVRVYLPVSPAPIRPQ